MVPSWWEVDLHYPLEMKVPTNNPRFAHSLLLLPNEPEVVGSSSGIGLVLVGGGPAISTRNERDSLYITAT